MKKTLFIAFSISLLTLFWQNNAHSYQSEEVVDFLARIPQQPQKPKIKKTFMQQLVGDTMELYEKGRPEFQFGTYYDCLANENSKLKIVGGFPALAWRFISIDPAFAYTPDRANRTGEMACFFSLRLGRIPISEGVELRDIFDEKIFDPLSIGAGGSYSLVEHSFGFGIKTVLKW